MKNKLILYVVIGFVVVLLWHYIRFAFKIAVAAIVIGAIIYAYRYLSRK